MRPASPINVSASVGFFLIPSSFCGRHLSLAVLVWPFYQSSRISWIPIICWVLLTSPVFLSFPKLPKFLVNSLLVGRGNGRPGGWILHECIIHTPSPPFPLPIGFLMPCAVGKSMSFEVRGKCSWTSYKLSLKLSVLICPVDIRISFHWGFVRIKRYNMHSTGIRKY